MSGFEGVSPAVLDAWRAVQVRPTLIDPGPEWLSSADLGTLWGINANTARRRVLKMERQGLVESSRRSVVRANGVAYPVPVYRLIPKPKARRAP